MTLTVRGPIVARMVDAQRSITMALSRAFRWMQERRAVRARRLAWVAERLGLARAQETRELASRVELALGRLARLRAGG